SSDSGTVLFSLLISGKEAEILARLSAAPSTPEDLRRLDNHGNTALHYAAAGGCAAAIIELIERHGLDPDAVNLIGWSPFLVACRLGHLAAARVLARRADTRRVTVYGADGFTLAAAGNHVRLMEFLAGLALATDCGSDGGVNRDGSGGVARDEGYKGAKFAVEESDGGFRVARQLGAPLCPAAFRGAMGAMRYLLARGFPSDGAGDSAATWPLHAAAAGGCAEACSLLIEQAGASGSRRDINGLTPRQ
uniref:ANK_REP_REGION domain-containing protein n=1 Tax=Macrostomum lignano TaxID=282301 RepID=A0A1I8JHS6_9PLAT